MESFLMFIEVSASRLWLKKQSFLFQFVQIYSNLHLPHQHTLTVHLSTLYLLYLQQQHICPDKQVII